MTITDDVKSLGGLAATHELLRAGWSSRSLSHAVFAETLVRVRQGWYCLPDCEPQLAEAVRVGGRLGCISGAAHHNLWVRATTRLHVDVVAHNSRLRSRIDPRQRLSGMKNSETVVHWRDRTDAAGTRFVASPRECLRAMIWCCRPEVVVAAVDSALQAGYLSMADWQEDIRNIPRRLRRLLSRIDGRSESIIESLARFRLQQIGIEPRLQVTIMGVGRVDFLIGSRLVIEVDGRAYHSDPGQFEADRRRDARLSTRGYRVLRFSYKQVTERWSEVKSAITAAIARGDHLG